MLWLLYFTYVHYNGVPSWYFFFVVVIGLSFVNRFCVGSLYDFIHQRGEPDAQNKIDSSLLLQFAFDIARGMQYLHSQSISKLYTSIS